MSSEKGVKKQVSYFANFLGTSYEGEGISDIPETRCPNPPRDAVTRLISGVCYMCGTVEYDIAQLTCMCSTELKALFDPASGRDPSLEDMIANNKQDTINQIW